MYHGWTREPWLPNVRRKRRPLKLLHQYEGFEQRQLRHIQKVGFYSAFAGSILNGHAPQISGYAFGSLPISLKVVMKRRLRVFVGHRFNDAITPNLRHNLAIIFRGYGIQPWYSDSDRYCIGRTHPEAA